MIAIEEAGHVEIGAHVLDDHIRRVTPAAYSGIAVGKAKPLERSGVGTLDYLDAGADRRREAGQAEGFDPPEIGPDLRCHLLPPVRGTIGELRSKRRSRAGVDTQGGCAFGKQMKQILGDLIEQCAGLGFIDWGFCGRTIARARGYDWQGGGGRQRSDQLTASKQWVRQVSAPSLRSG